MNRKAKEELIEKNVWILMSFGITSNLIQSKWANDYALKGIDWNGFFKNMQIEVYLST